MTTSQEVEIGVGPSRPLEPSNGHSNPLTATTMTGAGPNEDLPPRPPTTPHPDEVAAAQLSIMGPYTTFQQLSIALPLPLDTLAEECVIPPTYKSLLEYKAAYEAESTPEFNGDTGEEQIPAPPFPVDVLWFYRDPKGVVQGASMVILFNEFHSDWATLQVHGRRH